MATRDDFQTELDAQIGRAKKQGRPHVEINSGELHRVLGGYPAPSNHNMPDCCAVMRATMGGSDVIVYEPPKGAGASLTIRYHFPT